jgi:hypothetical protein
METNLKYSAICQVRPLGDHHVSECPTVAATADSDIGPC